MPERRSAARHRRLGARLLPQLPEPPARLSGGVVERRQLGARSAAGWRPPDDRAIDVPRSSGRATSMSGSGDDRLVRKRRALESQRQLEVEDRELATASTSPEELIAAAHASCFSMALSHGLAQAGHAPDQLDVSAVVSFEQVEGGWKITSSELEVRAPSPGWTRPRSRRPPSRRRRLPRIRRARRATSR